ASGVGRGAPCACGYFTTAPSVPFWRGLSSSSLEWPEFHCCTRKLLSLFVFLPGEPRLLICGFGVRLPAGSPNFLTFPAVPRASPTCPPARVAPGLRLVASTRRPDDRPPRGSLLRTQQKYEANQIPRDSLRSSDWIG